jgi:CBS domain containing-hemolysin-like protein
MSFIDIFAIACLALLVLSTIAILVVLGMLPGRIARGRQHPYAHAVRIAGWIGLLFIPLWPLALIWAYVDVPRPTRTAPDLDEMRHRIAALEDALHIREAAE